MAKTYDLGPVTAYAEAVAHGYTGTEAQFAEELTGATAAARAAAQDAEDAEAYAAGTRNGVDVASTDPAYHNNAKYYSETLQVDDTLSVTGRAADAKKVGDEIADLKGDLNESVRFDIQQNTTYEERALARRNIGFSEAIENRALEKHALLALLKRVVYDTPEYESLYENLRKALYHIGTDMLDVSNDGILGAYYNADGDLVYDDISKQGSYYTEAYYPVEPGETYYWVRGHGNLIPNNDLESESYPNNISYSPAVYRVLFYDENKNFINRVVSAYSTSPTFAPQGYWFEFTVPQNAYYIRVSWGEMSGGFIVKNVPNTLYQINFTVAKLDDADIVRSNATNTYDLLLRNHISVIRNNEDITEQYITDYRYVNNGVFSFIQGKSTQYYLPDPNLNPAVIYATNRLIYLHPIVFKYGDIIRFRNIKFGIRCENVIDGTAVYSSAWITEDTDYIVGVTDWEEGGE